MLVCSLDAGPLFAQSPAPRAVLKFCSCGGSSISFDAFGYLLIPIWLQCTRTCQSWTIRRRCRITKCCLTRLDVLSQSYKAVTRAVWPAARAHSTPFLVGGIEVQLHLQAAIAAILFWIGRWFQKIGGSQRSI